MDETFTKIQVYLIKKDKECENLRFLTSRTTPSNAAHVSDVCDTIKKILDDPACDETGKAPFEDPRSIQNLKFLLLNTNFKSQECMCEDLANGHLVDICPPLSPYLFVELVWTLSYEDILCAAILYVPMDLCSEILTVLRRCLDVEFRRAFETVLKVVTNCYKKLIIALRQEIQALEDAETLKRFVGSIQELVAQLPTLQARNIEGLSQLSKHERCGWVLRRLLNTIRTCVEAGRLGETEAVEDGELEKLYRLTFGRDFMVRLDPTLVGEALDQFNKQLVDLLLVNVKKIDCYVYMGWAEIDCDDGSTSMQRDVGLACYHFIEFLGADQTLEEYTHVVECLRQLSSKPEAPSSMNLEELCAEIDKGNAECLRKLIERYEEWDSTAISCLDRNRASIEKSECSSLLNVAVKILANSSKDEIYPVAVKILLGQKILDLIEIVVEFIIVHDASRKLESANFEADLKSYVNQGLALCSSQTSLRVVLFFLIQNPREVLKTLIKTCIGYSEYSNGVMLPEDLCKLSPILKIRDSNGVTLFSNTLRDICRENSEWSGKKFVNLIRVSAEKRFATTDEIFNDVFTPVLKTEIVPPNLQTILICVRTMKDNVTNKFNRMELLYALGLQMARLRRSTDVSFNGREESMSSLVGAIDHFARARRSGVEYGADLFSQKLEADLEPLDRFYFAACWSWTSNETCFDHILDDYKRRCFRVAKNLLTTEDFLQHFIMRCTEFEYLRFAKEAIIIHCGYFGWNNELEAFEKFSLATSNVCSDYLESNDVINSLEFKAKKVSSLIKSLASLTAWFISIDVMNDYESVQKSLVASLNALSLSHVISSQDLSHYYKEFKSGLYRSLETVSTYESVSELADSVDKFVDRCVLQISNQSLDGLETGSSYVERFHVNSTLISVCLGWPADENTLLLYKIDKKLFSV